MFENLLRDWALDLFELGKSSQGPVITEGTLVRRGGFQLRPQPQCSVSTKLLYSVPRSRHISSLAGPMPKASK